MTRKKVWGWLDLKANMFCIFSGCAAF